MWFLDFKLPLTLYLDLDRCLSSRDATYFICNMNGSFDIKLWADIHRLKLFVDIDDDDDDDDGSPKLRDDIDDDDDDDEK